MGAADIADKTPRIWWSNAIFFVSIHFAAFIGLYYYPPFAVPKRTLLLSFIVWQLADFGITIGYHRLYSHRSFRASFGVRVALAVLGSAGFQGSIKWCASPMILFTTRRYAATRGLFYSHMGWIFYKPTYERMALVDKEDLESDPVVCFQHNYYIPLALFFGFVLPSMIGLAWKDPIGAFVWGGLVSRLAIWHCTFLVNSLAHWDGVQPYSDEDTSRGNLILALLTGGEGSHNFHAFPHDFRSGPSALDWDPSKWIILCLNRLGFATGLRRARIEDMKEATEHMTYKSKHGIDPPSIVGDDTIERWSIEQVKRNVGGRCIILINDLLVDVTSYLGDHPGGAAILRKYSFRTKEDSSFAALDSSWAFEGGLNNHSRAARRRMKELVIARLVA